MEPHQVGTNDSVISVCKELEDPRDPRGVRHPWWVLVSILVAGLLSDPDTGHSMPKVLYSLETSKKSGVG